MTRKDIKKYLQETQKTCMLIFSDNRKRMLWRSRIDIPEKLLPRPFRFLQKRANIVRLTEYDGDRVISEKEYNFRRLNEAIEEFLKDCDEKHVICY